MSKNEIHSEIGSLSDKINYLNDKLRKEAQIHPVELDILNGYSDRLAHLIKQLENAGTANSTHEEAEVVEEIIQETKPETVKLEKDDFEKEDTKEDPLIAKTEDTKLPEAKEKKKKEQKKEVIAPPQNPTRESIHLELMTENANEEITEEPEPIEEPPKEETKPEKESKQTNGQSLSLNDRFKKDSFELADIIQKEKKERLKDVFDLNQRYTFTKELFDNDQTGFEKTLKDLESYNDPEEVFNYMERNFESKLTSEEKSDYVTRFTALVIQNIMA